jgi:hypothetical protein
MPHSETLAQWKKESINISQQFFILTFETILFFE